MYDCGLLTGSDGDNEEAEYAWLPVDCLKPFVAGDETGDPNGVIPGDYTLKACVTAAERAVTQLSAGALDQEARSAADAAEGPGQGASGELEGTSAEDSDSDGGIVIIVPDHQETMCLVSFDAISYAISVFWHSCSSSSY